MRKKVKVRMNKTILWIAGGAVAIFVAIKLFSGAKLKGYSIRTTTSIDGRTIGSQSGSLAEFEEGVLLPNNLKLHSYIKNGVLRVEVGGNLLSSYSVDELMQSAETNWKSHAIYSGTTIDYEITVTPIGQIARPN